MFKATNKIKAFYSNKTMSDIFRSKIGRIFTQKKKLYMFAKFLEKYSEYARPIESRESIYLSRLGMKILMTV